LSLADATIADLTDAARREVEIGRQRLAGALQSFVNLGDIALEVKRRLVPSEFDAWCADLRFHHGTISQAMRLATYKDQLPAEAFGTWTDARGHTQTASIRRSLTYLRGLPVVGASGKSQVDESVKAEAIRLRADGVREVEVAAMLGVSTSSVYNWCNPEAYERIRAQQRAAHKNRERQRSAQARALAEKQRREERDQLARITGGELGRAYALVRQALAALDRGRVGEAALRHLHHAEDAIVAALRDERTE
jgi:transposase